ncbi:Retrovirus-related Pol polyprotein from transposon 412 [Araneus ventricosus]|uniref:Retrovirus-related Pol polyprotein from transposon 412 n=1 Tax=Araneus ventricosus TaxID=182803 RepID=A0A4Y2UYL1_ARAVE|nr:Retrovirus-related Pol polyprotein from transposon 412 [Araneus ventricosus]
MKAPLKLVPLIQEVFSKINIDACGPLPETPKGNRYLITAICLTSKYPEAIPVADINSVSVTDALLNIFSGIRFPQEVQTDQGTSFTSALTSKFFERFGIKICNSSVYHPQSNPVERFHRTVKRLLRVLCLEAGEEWEKNLPSELLALRTVTHESIEFFPSELVFGKNLRTPETLLYEKWFESEEDESPVTEYVFQLINRLKRCQEVAVKQMEELQIKRKKRYDKNVVKREFKEGDLVLVLATGRRNKFGIRWMGPVAHDIQPINEKLVRSKPYRSSHRQNEILKTEVQRMLDLKIVEVRESDYTSPVILVVAPGKVPRPCVD